MGLAKAENRFGQDGSDAFYRHQHFFIGSVYGNGLEEKRCMGCRKFMPVSLVIIRPPRFDNQPIRRNRPEICDVWRKFEFLKKVIAQNFLSRIHQSNYQKKLYSPITHEFRSPDPVQVANIPTCKRRKATASAVEAEI